MNKINKKRFDLKEAAEILGLSEASLRRKAKRREISHYRPCENGKFYFDEQHLREFEEQRTVKAEITA